MLSSRALCPGSMVRLAPCGGALQKGYRGAGGSLDPGDKHRDDSTYWSSHTSLRSCRMYWLGEKSQFLIFL
jgi:hypothetical protein